MNNLDHIKSGLITANALNLAQKLIKVGATPLAIEEAVTTLILNQGGKPAFKGYQGYKYTSCISINETIVHGIPSNIPFESGDVVSIDLGTSYNGWITDAAITVAIKPISNDIAVLVKATKDALHAGIAQAKDGNKVGDISAAIEAVANKHNLGVIRDLSGHGVGKTLHEKPTIPNFGRSGTGETLKAGMTIAIEPMFSLRPDSNHSNAAEITTAPDNWSIMLSKGNLGAHFEHTILVTKNEPIILTKNND